MPELTSATQTVIITGANSGLGYSCARAIARSGQGWHIIIASRDPSKVEESTRNLIAETQYPHVAGMLLNLESLASVRQFTQTYLTLNYPPLHAIICNAGVRASTALLLTEDGFEQTFGINHLGHFLLVNLLVPHLIDPARIIFVSSDTHDPKTNSGMPHPQYRNAYLLAYPDNDQDGKSPKMDGRTRYTTSKLCNVLCAYELSRRLQKQSLHATVNVFNPGLMLDTNFYTQVNPSVLPPAIPSSILEKARSSTLMGNALARLVLDPSLQNTTGKYFDGFDEIPSSEESYDANKAAELWELSTELVQLTPQESHFL